MPRTAATISRPIDVTPDDFRVWAEILPEPTLLSTTDGLLLAANRAVERRLGMSRATITGRRLAEVVSDPPDRVTDFLRASSRSRDFALGSLTLTTGGRELPCRCEGALLRPRDGEPALLLLRMVPKESAVKPFLVLSEKVEQLAREVVRRQVSERKLQESELRFRQLAENITAVFWMTDPRGPEILYASPAYETVWGRPRTTLTGQPEDFLTTLHPDDREPARAALRRQSAGEQTSVEYRVIRPDGSQRWVWDRGFPIRDIAGRVYRVAGIAEDITGRKQSEEAHRELDRRKDEFIGTLAHELRNPLAPVTTSLYILRLPGVPAEKEAQAREVIERQVGVMNALLRDLLDVSRLMRDKFDLHRERVDLRLIVERGIETARPLIDAHGHELTVTLPAERIVLDGDLLRLGQVVGNLLTNAAKFTDPGGRIVVSAELVESSAEATSVELRVRDTGIGIPAASLTQIFEPFVHDEQIPGRLVGGLGIGLTLVKRLVERHGGTVTATSDGPGTGSTFTVRLPLTPE